MKPEASQNFKDFLREEFRARTVRNAQYSLRAFARSLRVSPSGLSMILSGKTPVTFSFIAKTAGLLNLKKEKIRTFQLQLLAEKGDLGFKLPDFEFIDANTFSIIREWYHYAILNLMRTRGFQQKPIWIARRLGISLPEAQTAIETLQKVGLLKINKGEWQDTSSLFTSHTNNKKASEAARQNQITLFKKAVEAIEQDPFEKRNHTGSTIALDLADLEQAKDMITNFRKEFILKFDKKSNADEVYHLSVGLFSLTKLRK